MKNEQILTTTHNRYQRVIYIITRALLDGQLIEVNAIQTDQIRTILEVGDYVRLCKDRAAITCASNEDVSAISATVRVVSDSNKACSVIPATGTRQHISTRSAVQNIIASATIQVIVTRTAIQRVGSVAINVHRLLMEVTMQVIIAGATG